MENRLVTVFGGGGFVGRYVAQELLARGARVRIAERNPGNAVRIKPLGGLGQTQLMSADITKPASVARAVEGADVVINLVGVLTGAFDKIQREGAETVAKAAAAAGATALVQISAIGADTNSPSAYGRSKGEGEAAVRAAFPGATIVRPSIIFGREDQFLNRFAQMIRMVPVVPVISGGTKFQPVYVVDVAKAIAIVALDPANHGGKTYELGGPQVLTMQAINRWIADAIGRKKLFIDVPAPAASIISMLPGGPIAGDQLKMLAHDNVVAPGASGFEALGIAPSPIAAVADGWMVKYRKHGRFSGRAEA
ncbi:MAG: complex I NDUFA9 subunit family protein [Sphingobium sp.]